MTSGPSLAQPRANAFGRILSGLSQLARKSTSGRHWGEMNSSTLWQLSTNLPRTASQPIGELWDLFLVWATKIHQKTSWMFPVSSWYQRLMLQSCCAPRDWTKGTVLSATRNLQSRLQRRSLTYFHGKISPCAPHRWFVTVIYFQIFSMVTLSHTQRGIFSKDIWSSFKPVVNLSAASA